MTDLKVCKKCGAIKSLSDFPRRLQRSADGYRATCRTCTDAVPARSPEARRIERAKRAERAGRSYQDMESYRQRLLREREKRQAERAQAKKVWRALREALLANRAAKAKEREAAWERARRKTAKVKARRVLQDAVRRGTVIKPALCEGCTRPCEPSALHGHHADYDQPLSVQWLCTPRHVAAHGGRYATPPASNTTRQ